MLNDGQRSPYECSTYSIGKYLFYRHNFILIFFNIQLIEDSEERLSEEQVNEILQIVAKHFPNNPTENN